MFETVLAAAVDRPQAGQRLEMERAGLQGPHAGA